MSNKYLCEKCYRAEHELKENEFCEMSAQKFFCDNCKEEASIVVNIIRTSPQLFKN